MENSERLRALLATPAGKVLLAVLILDTVRDMGDTGAPSGVVYAALCGVVSIDDYQTAIETLVAAKHIVVRHHVLYALPERKEK